jgi:hypothetical protein
MGDVFITDPPVDAFPRGCRGLDGGVVGGDEGEFLGLLGVRDGRGLRATGRGVVGAGRGRHEGNGRQRPHLQHAPPIRHDRSAYARVVWEGSREAEHVG